MATQPRIDDELVPVFDTEQESEAMVVRGLLQSAGIQAIITGRDAPQDILPVGGVVVRVPAQQADDARRTIEEYRTSGAPEEGESANDSPPEP